MLTRSGGTFYVGETSAPMEPNIQDTLNTLIEDRKNEPTATRS